VTDSAANDLIDLGRLGISVHVVLLVAIVGFALLGLMRQILVRRHGESRLSRLLLPGPRTLDGLAVLALLAAILHLTVARAVAHSIAVRFGAVLGPSDHSLSGMGAHFRVLVLGLVSAAGAYAAALTLRWIRDGSTVGEPSRSGNDGESS